MLRDNIVTSRLALFSLLLSQYRIKDGPSTLGGWSVFLPWDFPALHRHFLSKPHNISLRYCQTGDEFHSLIMWNTLVNIDVPFRKLLRSVFCSSRDGSQGVRQWCNLKLSAPATCVRGADGCAWQALQRCGRRGGRCLAGRLAVLPCVLPFFSCLPATRGVPPVPPLRPCIFRVSKEKKMT